MNIAYRERRDMSLSKRRLAKERLGQLAQARIEILWQQALGEAKEQPEIARRMMSSACKIAQRARIKMSRHTKRRICKNCGSILIPGSSCRVRVRHNRVRHVVVTCSYCGTAKRFNIFPVRPKA
jgi:ribonuclease P protein subunit RPR2